jgi:hypothetical protein
VDEEEGEIGLTEVPVGVHLKGNLLSWFNKEKFYLSHVIDRR